MKPVEINSETTYTTYAEVSAVNQKPGDDLNAPEEYKEALEKLTHEFRDIFGCQPIQRH